MRVLVAIDGSDIASLACAQATELADLTEGPLRFVAVVPPPDILFGGVTPALLVADEPVDRAAERYLAACLETEVQRACARVETSSVLRRGRPSTEIVAEAERWDADIIVVGSRGHGTLATITLGSVSQEVVDLSDRPVLVARRPHLRRMVVGVDPADETPDALAFLSRHALLGASEVTVVGVARPRYPWWMGTTSLDGVASEELLRIHDRARAATRGAIEAAMGRLSGDEVPITGRLREGQPAAELELAVTDRDADVVVVGARRHSAIGALILGSVSRSVLQHATSSVLVVHPARPAARPTSAPVSPQPEASETREHPMRILLAYDESPGAIRALTTAAQFAKALGATIDVISVVPVRAGRSPVDPWDDQEVHTEELADARKRLAILGLECHTIQPSGPVAHEIERVAREGTYDMVVVGSRELGSLARFLEGSVSEHVATHATTTVVVAR